MHKTSIGRWLAVATAAFWIGTADSILHGQAADRTGMSAEALYRAACAACHGSDGKGQPQSVVGFDTPLPDLTDCAFSTPEADLDWSSVIHLGGRARALDRSMPAFIDALSGEEIATLIDYLRGFCRQRGWPPGELNFPRTFFTEKAFPENEAVLTTTVASHPGNAVGTEFLFEHRLGRRAQYEVKVPVAFQSNGDGHGWSRGLGDVNVALKQTLFDSLRIGTIVAAGGEVTLPTGKEAEGLGGGVTIFEGFAMVNQALPSDGFVQFHAGFERPADLTLANREVYWRTAIGKSYFKGRFGRSWSPMVELLGAKKLGTGAGSEWDVVPQMQVSLSGLQHVLLSVGLRVPVNAREGRSTVVVTYLLWDWFDGGLFSNWRTQ